MPGIKYIARVLRGANFKKMDKMLTVVKEKSGHGKARTFADMLWCGLRYGAGYYDYTMFGFYDMKGRERNTYLTRVRNKKVCELMNQPGFGELFDDKLAFNERFRDFLHRRVLNAETATLAELEDFLTGQEAIFAKPNRGTCGNGIEKLRVADFDGAQALLDYVRERKLPVLEQVLTQHPEMARLHPQSVNTLRIVTDLVDDTVHVAYVVLKVGTGDGFCDNSGQGGVICRVDPESGTVVSVATDDYFQIFEKHPDTGIEFRGFRIPLFDEAVALAKQAARVVPEIAHVGWDVAITPDGPVLIEGNDYPGTDLCQLAPHYPEKCGLWPYYKELLHIKK